MPMKAIVVLVAVSSWAAVAGADTWSEQARHFKLGPVSSQLDLRNMLSEYIVRRSCEALDATAKRRRERIAAGEWLAWRNEARDAVEEDLGELPFGDRGGPLNVRHVSREVRDGFVVENVLFESLPGLDVNASVYLPQEANYPPPWPAIVIPVGHSCKLREDYQLPPQVFARLGYVAVTFDPPGMAGEKQAGNDHFVDGVRCYLTGCSSNRYFVVDALRCVDYLASRPDVDMTNGVGMTGVSGGGMTTLFATVLDDRIGASGPACCAVPNALHPVLDMYAPCPETLAFGRFGEYDDMDLLAAAMPTPVLLMAGKNDEVFVESMSRAIARDVGESFQQASYGDRFSFFLDDCGHAYSVPMALEFVKWMDTWIRKTPGREIPAISKDDLEMLPDNMLICHPRQDRNIFSVNKDVASDLGRKRSAEMSGISEKTKQPRTSVLVQAVREVARLSEALPGMPEVRTAEAVQDWFHDVQEILLVPEEGIELPATYLYPNRKGWRGGAVLYFDDRGRWTDLRTQGLLAPIAGFIERETDGPAVLTVDLRGWGDTKPADIPYDIAGWGHRERWNAYVTAALGDPILAMRIRDGLSALAYLRSRAEIDPEKVVLGGRGMGGVVALHVAAMDGKVAGAFSIEGLASFESLATSEPYSWSPEAFYPNVLKRYDIPDLVPVPGSSGSVPTLIVSPLGPTKNALGPEEIEALFNPGEFVKVLPTVDPPLIRDFVRGVLRK